MFVKREGTQKLIYYIIVVLIFILGYNFVTYEEGATASRVFGFKGIYTQPITDWPVTQIFVSSIFAWLYSLSQNIPWYGIIDYSIVTIAIILFFRIIIHSKQYLLLVPLLVLIIDDIVLFSFTRTAMLASTAGLLSLFFEFRRNQDSKLYLRTILLSLLCLYGFFNRPQAFMYSLVLFLSFVVIAFIIAPNKLAQVKKNKFYFVIPLALVSVFLIINQINTPPSIRQAQKLAPVFYNIHSSDYHKPFEELSKKDSLTLVLIKDSYVNDLEVMNKEFTDRITEGSPKEYISLKKFTNKEYLYQSIKGYYPFYIKNHLYDILLLIIILFSIAISKDLLFKQKIGVFIFVLVSIGSLFLVTNIVKMEMRISSPVFLFTFVGLVFLIHLSNEKECQMKKTYLVALLMGVSVYFTYSKGKLLYDFSKKRSYRVDQNLSLKEKLDNEYSGKTLVLSNSSLGIVHRRPFQEFRDKKTFRIEFFEGEAMVYQPTAQKAFIEYCGSLKIEDIFDTMFSEKEETFYLSTPDGKELMIEYLKAHYQKEYVMIEYDTLKYHSELYDDIILYKPHEIITENSTMNNK